MLMNFLELLAATPGIAAATPVQGILEGLGGLGGLGLQGGLGGLGGLED